MNFDKFVGNNVCLNIAFELGKLCRGKLKQVNPVSNSLILTKSVRVNDNDVEVDIHIPIEYITRIFLDPDPSVPHLYNW